MASILQPGRKSARALTPKKKAAAPASASLSISKTRLEQLEASVERNRVYYLTTEAAYKKFNEQFDHFKRFDLLAVNQLAAELRDGLRDLSVIKANTEAVARKNDANRQDFDKSVNTQNSLVTDFATLRNTVEQFDGTLDRLSNNDCILFDRTKAIEEYFHKLPDLIVFVERVEVQAKQITNLQNHTGTIYERLKVLEDDRRGDRTFDRNILARLTVLEEYHALQPDIRSALVSQEERVEKLEASDKKVTELIASVDRVTESVDDVLAAVKDAPGRVEQLDKRIDTLSLGLNKLESVVMDVSPHLKGNPFGERPPAPLPCSDVRGVLHASACVNCERVFMMPEETPNLGACPACGKDAVFHKPELCILPANHPKTDRPQVYKPVRWNRCPSCNFTINGHCDKETGELITNGTVDACPSCGWNPNYRQKRELKGQFPELLFSAQILKTPRGYEYHVEAFTQEGEPQTVDDTNRTSLAGCVRSVRNYLNHFEQGRLFSGGEKE